MEQGLEGDGGEESVDGVSVHLLIVQLAFFVTQSSCRVGCDRISISFHSSEYRVFVTSASQCAHCGDEYRERRKIE